MQPTSAPKRLISRRSFPLPRRVSYLDVRTQLPLFASAWRCASIPAASLGLAAAMAGVRHFVAETATVSAVVAALPLPDRPALDRQALDRPAALMALVSLMSVAAAPRQCALNPRTQPRSFSPRKAAEPHPPPVAASSWTARTI